MPGAYVMAVVILPELAFGHSKRYLLHCAQPYRTSKATRDVSLLKAVRGRTVIPKRHETCRNPKYIKAVRGRTAIQNILKRQ